MTDSTRREPGSAAGDPRPLDGGAYIGNRPELAEETIPGGLTEDDERVAAHDTRSSGSGAEDDRLQGPTDEWPAGHREATDRQPG